MRRTHHFEVPKRTPPPDLSECQKKGFRSSFKRLRADFDVQEWMIRLLCICEQLEGHFSRRGSGVRGVRWAGLVIDEKGKKSKIEMKDDGG